MVSLVIFAYLLIISVHITFMLHNGYNILNKKVIKDYVKSIFISVLFNILSSWQLGSNGFPIPKIYTFKRVYFLNYLFYNVYKLNKTTFNKPQIKL